MKKILISVFAIAIAAFTFTSCDDVPMPYDDLEVNGGGTSYEGAAGDGTLASPYNVAGALQYIRSLEAGVEYEQDIYIQGVVSSIEEEYTTNYGNGTFYITDPGTNLTFYVYRALYLGNKKFTSSDKQIKIGDEVIICGKVVNYKGNTPETVTNKAYLYALNGAGGNGGSDVPSGEATGDGTQANPFNVAAAIAKCQEIGTTESTEKYYVKGYVAAAATAAADYGNITFDMVDAEGGATFKAYQVAGTNGAKLTGSFKVNKGDEVVVYGPIYNYYGNTPETAGKSAAQIVSVNGKSTDEVSGDDSGNTGGDETQQGDITKNVNGLVVTFTKAGVTAGESVTYDLTTCGLAHETENPSFTMNGASFAFAKGDGTTTPKYWKTGNYDEFRVYAKNMLTIVGAADIASVAFQCTNNGSTPAVGNEQAFATINGKTLTFVNDWTTTGGGTQFRIKSVTITYAK